MANILQTDLFLKEPIQATTTSQELLTEIEENINSEAQYFKRIIDEVKDDIDK
jgi:hypothetical protein